MLQGATTSSNSSHHPGAGMRRKVGLMLSRCQLRQHTLPPAALVACRPRAALHVAACAPGDGAPASTSAPAPAGTAGQPDPSTAAASGEQVAARSSGGRRRARSGPQQQPLLPPGAQRYEDRPGEPPPIAHFDFWHDEKRFKGTGGCTVRGWWWWGGRGLLPALTGTGEHITAKPAWLV